jgi:preprotein translocase subunit SecA
VAVLKLVSRFAGDPNQKELDRLQPLVDEVGELEPRFKDSTDQQLRDKTIEFLDRLHAGESLDDLLPEAFAAVREASKRTTSMRHFDVQILGGILLHQGKVVEMKTGEGKTLVATLPLYLNALAGHGAHLVTVNDYLARRDVQWMGPIYHLLGLTTGLLQQGEGKAFVYDPDYTQGDFKYLRPVPRKEAYQAHITYGTNHEYGFDYLRDNLAYALESRVQRELHYAIIDEVDNILIDEARTPLIISGPSDEPLEEYRRFARIARKLRPDVDYELDEKERNVVLTDGGLAKVEAETGIENIYDEANYQYVHYMEQALRAHVLFHKDRDYIRQGQRIVLVDEFTGRLMPDRRLSEGLHQAIEAKEGVPIRPRMMTQATITLQNYFRMYEKLAGMTGTAATEAEELDKIYELDVVVLPTNVEYMARGAEAWLVEKRRREDGVEIVEYYDQDDPDEPLFYRRADYQDVVYKSEKAKWEAITAEIEEFHRIGRPVLVGTTSVEKSERLSALLKARGVSHEVLNAKNHTREAAIITRAGEPGSVTIATNMAGRGVDIKLGGELSEDTVRAAHKLMRGRGVDPYHATSAQLYTAIAEVDPDYVRRREQVLGLGGLHVLGTERHEARRIDNQLRGRAGRQGEPGSSRFYLSLEDDLMRRFGGPSVAGLMDRLGVEEDIPIEHGMVSKTIEGAQTKVEGYNFDIRKHLLEYDDVLNRQRELIYGRRYRFLTSQDLEPELWDMIESELDRRLEEAAGRDGDTSGLLVYLNDVLPLSLAPPDSPFPYQFPFLGKLTCLPPFTVLFLASQLANLPGEQVPERLLEIAQQASDEYREHLLTAAVHDPFETTLDQYKDGMAAQTEFLENKIDDYVALAEEQGRSLSSHDLLQYVQTVFTIPLKVKPSDLRGLSIPEATDFLLAQLEGAYHQELGDRLLRTAQLRIPSTMKPDQVRVSDISEEAMQALLDGSTYAEDDSSQKRLASMAQGKGGLFDTLAQMNTAAQLDLSSLRRILAQAVTLAYDRWAGTQLREMDDAISQRESKLRSASEHELALHLLGIIYGEKAEFDKGHLRRFSFAPRLPLEYLALPSFRSLPRDQIHDVLLETLETALLSRQETWGHQELARLGQFALTDLDSDFSEGLSQQLGRSVIEQAEDRTVGELDERLHNRLRVYVGIKEIQDVTLADVGIHEQLVQHLERQLGASLADSGVAAEEHLVQEIEEYLLVQGYFEATETRGDLLHKPIAQLDGTVRESIAALTGEQELAQLRDRPVAEWDDGLRLHVLEYLRGRGHFVDEQKVQRFFVHGTLADLDSDAGREACAYIARRRLEKFADRTLGSLKGDLRERVLGHFQRRGLLVDEAKRADANERPLSQLDEAAAAGLIEHLGQQQLEAAGTVSALPQDALEHLQAQLRESGFFRDQNLLDSFPQMRLSELEGEFYAAGRDHLFEKLENDLDGKLFGELPLYAQEMIRAYLVGTEYLRDEDKAAQFESLTLSALDAATVHEMEQHVGDEIVADLEQRKFMNLDQEVREAILRYLDLEGLFTKKKKREQFVKRSLSELDKGLRDGIAYHLGRERLTELREIRFSSLPDAIRDRVWEHLHDSGYFLDTEKEEYLEIEELKNLSPELREGLRTALKQGIEELVSHRNIDELPEEMRIGIREYLDEQQYFVDGERLAEFESAQAAELELEAYSTICRHLGQRIFAQVGDKRVRELPDGLREDVEAYLQSGDHFIDETKKEKFLQRRMADLDEEIFESLVRSLGDELAQESADSSVAEFDQNDREYLRDYLDSVGHFLDQDALASFEQGTLTSLKLDTRDYEGLASWLGKEWIEKNAERRFGELDQELLEAAQADLVSSGYFLDRDRLEQFREQGYATLDEETRRDALQYLSQKRASEIEGKRLADLEEETRREVELLMIQQEVGVDEDRMAGLKDRTLGDLDHESNGELAIYLGRQHLMDMEDQRIADLDESTGAELQRYVGKKLMHQIEKQLILGFTSRLWVDYLTAIEDLRQGIGLQAYGQLDPLVEYKRRAFRMFGELNDNINRMVVGNVFRYPPQPLRLGQGSERG